MKRIAVYGKGGIGKSVTVSNMSVALAQQGLKVMQIGCDPKADSTINITGGDRISTVLRTMREKHDRVEIEDIIIKGDFGVYCVEAGGPPPGVGCAGRGIITAFEKLKELHVYEKIKPDIVFYDVLGDVVCGGFAMPIRKGYADDVYVVTSGEMMSLYAANNIISAVRSNIERGYAQFRGLILNKKNVENEEDIVRKAAEEMNAEVLHVIPRDSIVQEAERQHKTVVEAFPDSKQALIYKELSRKVFGD